MRTRIIFQVRDSSRLLNLVCPRSSISPNTHITFLLAMNSSYQQRSARHASLIPVHRTCSQSSRMWAVSKGVSEADDSGFDVAKLKKLLTAGAIAATGMAAIPAGALALANPDTISGGALSVAATTSSLFDSLTETGFYQAFSLVFISEIGDKTFFIAGLLAMKTSRLVSYLGSMGALAAMTILSVLIGQIFHAVPSGIAQGLPFDDIAAIAAFTFFGLKTLKEALDMDSDGGVMDEEFAEAEETVEGSNTVKQSSAW